MFVTHKKRRKLAICPNCNTMLKSEDNFCPNCGQENHDLKIPLWHLVYEFVESIFHFDIKVWTTLKAIFTSPGKITNDFIEGKRVCYVNPARFYVFISFVLFLLIAVLSSSNGKNENNNEAKNSFSKGLSEGMKISTQKNQNDENLIKVDSTKENTKDIFTTFTDSISKEKYILIDKQRITEKLGRRIYADEKVMDSVAEKMKFGTGFKKSIKTKFLKGRIVFLLLNDVEKDLIGKEYYHTILKYTSYLMFIFMPLIAFLLLIVYYFKRKFYYEHLIFSVHLHTILFLFLIITLLMSQISFLEELATLGFIFGSIFYIIISLRRVYKQNYFLTIIKFLLISFIYLMLFTSGLIAISYYSF